MSVIKKEFKVEGMSCSHCERAIKNALNELNGVSNTDVDLSGKTVTVQYDIDLVADSDLVGAIEDAGYEVV
ncbi:heavy-metal-associated domain-containing protein [[Clostridium] fimetarium]|uniref:Copper chaperone CopZ n=1 Tax=[Clostridium] fimetarium TaxID=99656 RepID=A0A1I0M636_9FIRM|nr:copper ion binding protein [[Clostridium] fimetarium]SEV83935.1 copper chaperone [[Clostridium] fimetarium]